MASTKMAPINGLSVAGSGQPDVTEQSAGMAWNYDSGVGETDFFNVTPAADGGGFAWYQGVPGTPPDPGNPQMHLDRFGALWVNGSIETNDGVELSGAGIDFTRQGGAVTWDYDAGVGETDFFNISPSADGGGFAWYQSTPSAPPVANDPEMHLDRFGNLFVKGGIDASSVTVNGSPVMPVAMVQHEFILSAGGTQTFAHNLGTKYPAYSAWNISGTPSFTLTPIDTNSVKFSANGPTDTILIFMAPGAAPSPPPAQDFTVAVSPSSVIYNAPITLVVPPATSPFTVTQSASGGYSGAVTYSCIGLPAGATYTFTPPSVTGSGTTTLTIKFSLNQPAGSVSFSISGTDGTLTHAQTASVNVTASSDINVGLIEAWPINEGSGTTYVNPLTGNNMTAANITWQTISGHLMATYNGSATSYAAAATATSFAGGQSFTIMFWLVCTSPLANNLAFVTNLDSANNYVGFEAGGINASGFSAVHAILVGPGGYPADAIDAKDNSGTYTLVDGNLHQVILTFDGSSGQIDIYVNGTEWTPSFNSNTFTQGDPIASTVPVRIGNRSDGSFFIIGGVTFLRIYKRVFSPTDVSTYYALGVI